MGVAAYMVNFRLEIPFLQPPRHIDKKTQLDPAIKYATILE